METKPTFQLPDPSYEAYSWRLQDEHGPTSLPPLLQSQRTHRFMRSDGDLPRAININGYTYVRVNSANSSGGSNQALSSPFKPENVDDMKSWRQEWLPQVETVVRLLEAFEPSSVEAGEWEATLAAQTVAYQRVFEGVHRTAAIAAGTVARRFGESFTSLFGADREGEFLTLLQGFPNCSLDRASALWELSRFLLLHPNLIEALDRSSSMPDTAPTREFESLFAAMLDAYGCTSNAELEDMPTWREDPAIPLAVIRGYTHQPNERNPSAVALRQRDQRLKQETELRELAESDSAVAELIPLMEMAQQIVPNQEDHNFLVDQRMAAASRARWLSIGRHLESAGALAGAEDVFYFHLPELIRLLEGQGDVASEEIAARKALLHACRAMVPPAVIGAPLRSSADSEGLAMTEMTVLRGVAASSGSFRGRAQVIETLGEAARLEAGDVMICRTTTPSWTPFFSIISGLVTNSGGALSHGALVARELGLPAVVGTVDATNRIPDGSTVTVDGTNGIVVIEP